MHINLGHWDIIINHREGFPLKNTYKNYPHDDSFKLMNEKTQMVIFPLETIPKSGISLFLVPLKV